MPALDEEIQEQIEDTEDQRQEQEAEERDRQEALLALNQRIRRQQQQNSLKQQTANALKDQAKKQGKKAAWEFLISTSEIWGPALVVILIIAGIIGLFVVVAGSAVAYCSDNTWTGTGVRMVSNISGYAFGGDFCQALAINNGPSSSPPSRSGGGGGGAGFDTYTDTDARAALAAAGITVNAPQPQTSLEGVKVVTINEIINFKNSCGTSCDVVITGGTETTAVPPHAGGPCSHLSGNKVDIRSTASVNNFIQSNFVKIANRSDGAQQYQSSLTGVIYALESNHWDIGGVGC